MITKRTERALVGVARRIIVKEHLSPPTELTYTRRASATLQYDATRILKAQYGQPLLLSYNVYWTEEDVGLRQVELEVLLCFVIAHVTSYLRQVACIGFLRDSFSFLQAVVGTACIYLVTGNDITLVPLHEEVVTSLSEGVGIGGLRALRVDISLIDLAGSENAATDTERTREGKYINSRTLDNNALGKTHHVPYYNSKLTRILKPSLSGNRVKGVHLSAQEIVDADALNDRYRKKIKDLKRPATASTSIVLEEKEHDIIPTPSPVLPTATMPIMECFRVRLVLSPFRPQPSLPDHEPEWLDGETIFDSILEVENAILPPPPMFRINQLGIGPGTPLSRVRKIWFQSEK
ncbi:hypothetical protein BDQ17DRAFT_1414620 [Cyathus striatus]|nr:hypothetical protein BDQ17DRAFT_1414620 [Cyathus striatus]